MCSYRVCGGGAAVVALSLSLVTQSALAREPRLMVADSATVNTETGMVTYVSIAKGDHEYVSLTITCLPGFYPLWIPSWYQNKVTDRGLCLPRHGDLREITYGCDAVAQPCHERYELKIGGALVPFDRYAVVSVQRLDPDWGAQPRCLPLEEGVPRPAQAVNCLFQPRVNGRQVVYGQPVKLLFPKR